MDLEHFNFSELRDVEMATRMRKCNYEKFKTLVRMHLSFELDLNKFDLPCHEIVYEDKGKLRKWNRLGKKHKHGAVVAALASGSTGCALGGGNSNGSSYCSNAGISPPDNLHQTIDQGFLFHLQELKDFLMLNKNLQQEGIFRKTGSASRQNDLRMQIQNDRPLHLEASGYSAHDCATVFKGYLSELPEPLLTDAHYQAHLQIAPLCLAVNAQLDTNTTNEQKTYSISSTSSQNGERLKRELRVLNSIQLLLLLLPDENRQLLQHVIEMLHAVALQQQHNKMGSDNLATLFAPHLICPRNLPPEALHYLARKMSSIISYMIVRGQDIFSVPAKLATDIRAYFERKRKITMSPEMALDESISDISAVNTVYTFVDREKTAAATTTNNTDTALAQLYAHIQSLPESSKKRRLIKQFNKQNGQGTPLQLQAMNRIKTTDANRGAKSLSDSIKKHIFHKGIMSRTPKRQPVSSIVLETPNNCSMKQDKQRVLFQSPNPQINNSCSTDIATNSSSSLSSASTYTSTSASALTPYNIKTHPLQKSISSSSLLMTHNSHKQQQDQKSNSQLNKIVHKQELVVKPNSSLSHASNHSNSSSDGFVCNIKSVSAPVSRQTSSDLATQSINNNNSSCPFQTLDSNCCVTPLKLISDAAKHLIIGSGAVDKKSVAWNDSHTIDTHSMDTHTIDTSGNCPLTPLHELQQHTPANDLKSRYKSEPNLSLCHHDVCETPSSHSITPISTKLMPSKSITRKLMKGVSMGNIRFPFSTPDTRKRLVRTVSSTLKRRGSDDLHIYHQAEGSFAAAIKTGLAPLLQDMDEDDDENENNVNGTVDTNEDADLNDETFEDAGLHVVGPIKVALECTLDEETENHDVVYNVIEPYVGSGSSSSELNNFTGGSASYQQLLLQQSGIYRNLDLVTSTPSLLLGRRSMSPITKSTQRMPKAMQESIMTPRSRKPVMVLTTTVGSADHNQTINPNDVGEFQEHDENELDNDDTDVDNDLEEDVLDKTKSHDTPPQTEVINEDATSLGGYSDIFKRRQLLHANQSFVQQNKQTSIDSTSSSNSSQRKEKGEVNEKRINENQTAADELSKHFKEYLLSRSVLTAAAPPVDTSFSSHSDDYESSHEMDDIDENQLSSSLLYCLDGNRPESENIDNSNSYEDDADDETTTATNAKKLQLTTTAISSTNLNLITKDHISSISTPPTNRLANNPFVILNNARKRAAANDLEKISSLLFNSPNSPNCHSEFQRYATNLLRTEQLNRNKKYLSPAASSSISCSSSAAAVALENKENYQHNNEIYEANKKLMRDRQLKALGQAEDEDEDFPGETSF